MPAIMEENNTQQQGQSTTVNEDNAFFKHMLDFLPLKFYFQKNAHDLLTQKEEDNEEEDVDETSKSKKKSKKRMRVPVDPEVQLARKKARFDPSIPKTVTQAQEMLLQSEQEASKVVAKEKLPPPKIVKKEVKVNAKDDGDEDESIRSGTDSLEFLRERIQARINEFKEKRNAPGKMDYHEKRRLKRTLSKMEKKLNKKAERKNQKKQGTGDKVNDTPTVAAAAQSTGVSKKPIFNKDGNIVFSKFDFSESGCNKKKTDLPTGKDYTKILEKVNKKNEQLNELRKIDKEKAKEMEQKDAWKSALAKAEGIKVKDNPELLKKAIKHKEGRKKKSVRGWDDKKDALETKMKEQQDKRKKNLQQRHKGKVEKKLKKMKKKGHIIPGF